MPFLYFKQMSFAFHHEREPQPPTSLPPDDDQTFAESD